MKKLVVLLLSTFSSAYAGDCFDDLDVADCKVKTYSGYGIKTSKLGKR